MTTPTYEVSEDDVIVRVRPTRSGGWHLQVRVNGNASVVEVDGVEEQDIRTLARQILNQTLDGREVLRLAVEWRVAGRLVAGLDDQQGLDQVLARANALYAALDHWMVTLDRTDAP